MNNGVARDLLFAMERICCAEEELARRYGEDMMHCPVHLSIGQRAVAAAAGNALDEVGAFGTKVNGRVLAAERNHAQDVPGDWFTGPF